MAGGGAGGFTVVARSAGDARDCFHGLRRGRAHPVRGAGERTVKVYVSSLIAKPEASYRTEVVVIGARRGLVKL